MATPRANVNVDTVRKRMRATRGARGSGCALASMGAHCDAQIYAYAFARERLGTPLRRRRRQITFPLIITAPTSKTIAAKRLFVCGHCRGHLVVGARQ